MKKLLLDRRPKIWAALVLLAVVAVFAASTPAQASLILSSAGNTHPQFQTPVGGGVDSFLDFGVYDTAGESVGDTYGTGFAGIDAAILAGFGVPAGTGHFLYLYEVSNVSAAFSIGSAAVPGLQILAVGTLAGKSFFDIGGPVSSTHPFGPPAPPGDPSPAAAGGVTGGAIVANGAVFTPLVDDGGGAMNILFFPNPLAPGQTSALVGYMTDFGPGFGSVSVEGGGARGATGAAGTGVAAAIPEPSALVTCSVLSAFVLGLQFIRRRKGASAA
jgi:hypothetical protein